MNMKMMPALPESIFDIGYLLFAMICGIRIFRTKKGRTSLLMGIATLVLGCGDAFHLVPRVLDYWMPGDYTVALGIGKLVTSVTMTVFYVLLEFVRIYRYHDGKRQRVTDVLMLLAAARIALCLFVQNGWTSPDPSLLWGIYRNIPFVVIGIITVILWYRDARNDKPFRFLFLAVALSFAFYLPVVVLAKSIPIMGMLMLPKTVMYIWIICMFLKAE